jgi:hypothetical protein
MGFDPDMLVGTTGTAASAFDAYRRGNNALAAGIAGSGLGLAIVQAVLEQAGGRIAIQSSPGKGTQLSLKLPGSIAAGTDTAEPAREIERTEQWSEFDAAPGLDRTFSHNRVPPRRAVEIKHAHR